jgi:hypothetical protein
MKNCPAAWWNVQTHLACDATTWREPVTDEQYAAANAAPRVSAVANETSSDATRKET